jgi:predicted metal-dependent HD superfamily phosphohydrolase
MPNPLEQRWCELWRELGAQEDGLRHFHSLTAHYSEEHRAYHNLRHIEECLGELDTALNDATDRLAVELALWFHDVIYDPHQSDNEEKSAALMLKVCAGAGIAEKTITAAHDLIMATKTHLGSGHPDIPLLIDIDLSILGKNSERFDEYERQIRQEYSWVPAELYSAKRAEILEGFLRRSTIYSHTHFQKKYEEQARNNLGASIALLRRLGHLL